MTTAEDVAAALGELLDGHEQHMADLVRAITDRIASHEEHGRSGTVALRAELDAIVAAVNSTNRLLDRHRHAIATLSLFVLETQTGDLGGAE